MLLLGDFKTSVQKSFDEIDPNWPTYPGVVVCGTHTPKDTELIIKEITKARKGSIPLLGICMGLQLMTIEYFRNVLGIPDATSEEIGIGTPVVVPLGYMRTGIFPVSDRRMESHWHQYTVHPEYATQMAKNGWDTSSTESILEEASLRSHPHFVGVQYHPEYQSTPTQPHPVLKNFLLVCKNTFVA